MQTQSTTTEHHISYLFPDIDECQTTEGLCHSSARCINTEGSYDCVCESGFTGSGKDCQG